MENEKPLSKIVKLGALSLALMGCGSAIAINKDTVIYFNDPPLPEIVSHEKIHQQQIEAEGGAIIFWVKYLTDSDYACKMEIEAGASLTHPACSHILYENQNNVLP